MDRFEAEDGPILLGPWSDRAAVEVVLDTAIADAGRQRVGRYDHGFTAIARLVEQDGAWWLEPGQELAWHLPAELAGFGAMAAYSETDEWAPAVGALVFQVTSDGEGGFTVQRPLDAHRPEVPPDVGDLLAEALRRAAGLDDQPAKFVFHEVGSAFSCRVVEHTFQVLQPLASGTWQVARNGDEVRVQTPAGVLPSWRALTADEWQEIEAAL